MDDKTLALLGDKAAQERITERGELLPCPLCGKDVEERGPEDWEPTYYDPDSGGDPERYKKKVANAYPIGPMEHAKRAMIMWLEWRARQPDNPDPERTREILKGVRG